MSDRSTKAMALNMMIALLQRGLDSGMCLEATPDETEADDMRAYIENHIVTLDMRRDRLQKAINERSE